MIGEKRIVDVMDVSSQQALEMFLDDWVDYYTAPERQYLLNVISLEFSHTPMEHMVQSPRVVSGINNTAVQQLVQFVMELLNCRFGILTGLISTGQLI